MKRRFEGIVSRKGASPGAMAHFGEEQRASLLRRSTLAPHLRML
jgi:hypothetical protein